MRTFVVLFFVLSGLLPAALPAAAANHPGPRVAPADEYFGRLKLSILGIRNELHDLTLRVQGAPDRGQAVLGTAALVEDALHDWERKYPGDPWLAKDFYELTALYARVHTARGQMQAAHALHWLLDRYGRTFYGAQARATIHLTAAIR